MAGLVHRPAFGNSVSNAFVSFQGQSPEVISDGKKADKILVTVWILAGKWGVALYTGVARARFL